MRGRQSSYTAMQAFIRNGCAACGQQLQWLTPEEASAPRQLELGFDARPTCGECGGVLTAAVATR